MEPRPQHILPQTSKQAKAAYKKHGFRLSTRDMREIERAEELQRRADRIKEQERRKKLTQKRKAEKEQREREARAKSGIGLATQLAGYNHSQVRMKNGMESFLRKGTVREGAMDVLLEEGGAKKPSDGGSGLQIAVSRHKYAKGASEGRWSQDRLDDGTLLEADSRAVSEPWDIEDVDDEAFMDAIEDEASMPKQYTLKTLRQPELKQEERSNHHREDSSFVRLHGPVDAAIERLLDPLSDPLVEFLSQDISSNPNIWDPAPSLLHRLKPPDLPPHRLRIKVGCAVVLLTNLNTSIQISERSHLRILRIENERLECLVLDGRLEGTKSILTRVPFSAQYKSEDRYSFARMQFPVRVTTNPYQLQKKPAKPTDSHKRLNATHDNPENLPETKKLKVPEPFAKSPIPTLRILKSPTATKPQKITPKMIDFWDNFLVSGTQIARELSPEPVLKAQKATAESPEFMPCTQDLDFSAEDLEELGSSMTGDMPQIPQEIVPESCQPRSLQNSINKSPPKPTNYLRAASANLATTPQRLIRASDNPNRGMMLPPPLPAPSRFTKPATQPKTTPPLHQTIQPIRTYEQSLTPSLKDFGISTQDLVSIVEDDLPISSPPILV
ncbi:hypothetical protein V2W45_241282 [Cenococcum geophilum]